MTQRHSHRTQTPNTFKELSLSVYKSQGWGYFIKSPHVYSTPSRCAVENDSNPKPNTVPNQNGIES